MFRAARARPGQSQDGWKISEDGKSWERFEEHLDAQHTEEAMESLSPKESMDTDIAEYHHSPDTWRSLSFTREWLKSANSNETIAKVIDHIPQTPKLFRKHRDSPSMDSISERSPHDCVKDEGYGKKFGVDPPMMTEEPQTMSDPKIVRDQLSHRKSSSITESLRQNSFSKENIKTWAQGRDPRALFRQMEYPSSLTSNMFKKSQEIIKAEVPAKEEQPADTKSMHKQSSQDSSAASLLADDIKTKWDRRTPSFFGRKKNRETESNESGSTVTKKEDLENDIERTVEGLGISGAEQIDSGTGVVVLVPTEEEGAGIGVHERTQGKDDTGDPGCKPVPVEQPKG